MSMKDNGRLYFDVILDFNTRRIDAGGLCEVDIRLLSGKTFKTKCMENQIDKLSKDRILLINSKSRFNVMSFVSAKRHVAFKPDDYTRLSRYFNSK